MKFLLFYILLFLHPFSYSGYCQPLTLTDPVSSKTFNPEKYSGVRGTPFLFDDWLNGFIQTSRGIYNNLKLKSDIYNNQLYFERNQEAYEFTEEITAFTLMPNPGDSTSYMHFKKGFSANGLNKNQFVQILSEGKVSLYKSVIVIQTDLNQVNEGTVKSFSKSTRYYTNKLSTVSLIKLNEKAILELLKDQSEAIKKWIDENHLSLKKEQDIQQVFNYYNLL